MGRPSKYGGISLDQVRKLAELGLIDKEIAYVLGICEDSLNEYKKKPEFSESLKAGKEVSDQRVVQSLYQRAVGYSHPEKKFFCYEGEIIGQDATKHYPPDTTACIFWLKNRRKGEWKDKIVHAGDEDEPLGVIMYPVKKKAGEP